MEKEALGLAERRKVSFSVDTHLLRELGSLLVGRDSTALLELIKNSYDADSTIVTVDASGLGSPNGSITVVDDGNGMTFDRFENAFLRIAGRSKEGNRTSPRFGRRYTGAKGIGRLAAHKLSSTLEIVSIPREFNVEGKPYTSGPGVRAVLDWDGMEKHDDLTDLGDSLRAEEVRAVSGLSPGTSLTLAGVREVWDDQRLGPFMDEIRSCRPAAVLVSPLSDEVISSLAIFDSPLVREHSDDDPGFRLELTGDLAGGDELWQTLASRADWVVEIRATTSGVYYSIVPTERKKASLKLPADPTWARRYSFTGSHPDPERGPFFDARFLITEGSISRFERGSLARFSRYESGIRVFMEGFRVLPYGSPGDDWLQLDRDYVRRPRDFDIDVEKGELDPPEDEGFFQLGNRAYYGGVFLTEKGAPYLQALVNREGFVPDPYFTNLKTMVRAGADLATRVRGALDRRIKAAVADEKEARRKAAHARARAAATEKAPDDASIAAPGPSIRDSAADAESSESKPAVPVSGIAGNDFKLENEDGDADATRSASQEHLRSLLNDATSALGILRVEPLSPQAEVRVQLLETALDGIAARVTAIDAEQVTLRTLAGVGTQYSAFVHEVNGLLAQAQALRSLLDGFPMGEGRLGPAQRETMREARRAADELVQSLTRQTSYLTEVVGPDARRRRRRLDVRERTESALRLLRPKMVERQQVVSNEIPLELHSPPIFPAEFAIILTNLLSNATKFAGNGGRIKLNAHLDDAMTLHLKVNNTGTRVASADAERYFRPFESSTTDVDVVLGQGMGLGLPIVRTLLGDYNGEASFVAPDPGYATAVEVVLPDPRPDLGRKRLRA
jgi:signal transduction histidine kinase